MDHRYVQPDYVLKVCSREKKRTIMSQSPNVMTTRVSEIYNLGEFYLQLKEEEELLAVLSRALEQVYREGGEELRMAEDQVKTQSL